MARMDKHRTNKRKPNKKKKALRIILLSTLFVFLFAVGAGAYYFFNTFGKMKKEEIPTTDDGLRIDPNTKKEIEKAGGEDIINIALLGLDTQDKSDRGRSDSTIVLSIDKRDNKVKLVSFMRDSYVKIEGHGRDKLNHAHAYGGPGLTVKTLNENFGLNIKNYVSVNFQNMSEIIDALGGIEVNVTPQELSASNEYNINFYIREIAGLKKVNPPLVTKTGKQTLNGIQAVAYSRIRSTGNGDFDRTERQRDVLTLLFNKMKSSGVAKLTSLAPKLMGYVTTNMSTGDVIKLGTDVLGLSIEQERFPVDGYNQSAMINGTYYLKYDEEATKNQIFNYIYKDIKPTPKQ